MGEITLSKRLQAVADMVTPGLLVADVGCDHAYVSIYLVESNIASGVIAMDVKKGPLEIALHNIKSSGLERQITVRLSDGLSKLNQGEAEAVVIAGMGGSLMIRILEEGKQRVAEQKELILQPQSEIHKVREYLHQIGYKIVKEQMLIDMEKYYTLMKAVPGKEQYDNTAEYYYGKKLLEEKDPVLKTYLEKEASMVDALVKKLEKESTMKAMVRLKELLQDKERIKEALGYYEL